MTNDRWAEIDRSRQPAHRPAPVETDTRVALRMLTQRPEWEVFLSYLRGKEHAMPIDDADAPTLFRFAGRRAFLRHLEGLQAEMMREAEPPAV